MKKVEKGTPGYLNYKKKAESIRAAVYFGIVAAIFLAGYLTTHTRLNYLTVLAALGCLPSSKVLVGVITRFPYFSITPLHADEIQAKTGNITVAYDMILTSSERIMPIDCIAISGNLIFGYTGSEKVDLKYAAAHIKNILEQNGIHDVSVKVLNNYTAFLARAEGMNSIAAVEKNDTREAEEQMRRIILNVSM